MRSRTEHRDRRGGWPFFHFSPRVGGLVYAKRVHTNIDTLEADSMPSPAPAFVAEKRARKAQMIAYALRTSGLDANDAARLDPEGRREVEQAAGVKHPGSDETWRAVVSMLAGSVAPASRCQTCGIGAPDSIPGPPRPFGHDGPCAS